MSATNHSRVKRIHAEFRGDEAVELDILEVMLRMGEVARTRIEGDTRLVRLALKALSRVMTEYTDRTGQRYPSYVMLIRYLEDVQPGIPAEARVVSLPKPPGTREQA